MKKLTKIKSATLERYRYDNEYIVEVEELHNNETEEILWAFWLFHKSYDIKMYLFGLAADKDEDKEQAKAQALATVRWHLDAYILGYNGLMEHIEHLYKNDDEDLIEIEEEDETEL